MWILNKHKKIVWVFLVILSIVPVVWNLMRPGFFYMQDDLQAFRILELDRCLTDLQIPCRWVPDAGYGYGYPQFNYYPPSVYYIGALIHRLGFEYIDAVKILFVVGYITSAIAIFILVDSLVGSWPACVASILYTYVPYKAVEVYVRGAMSEFWSLTFFPLILWALYKLIKTNKNKYSILFSVFLGLLFLTHNLMTLIFAPVAIIWAVYWLIVEKKIKKWSKLLWSGLLGVGLASFFTLPVIFEKQFVHVESMLGGYFDYRAHFVSLYKLFISREWGYGSSGFPNELLNLSTGLVQWVIGLVAVFIGIFNFRRHKKLSLLILILSFVELFVLFMIHMKSSFIWAKIPILWWLQFPWRFLSVSIFILSLLGGLVINFFGRYKYLLGSIVIISAVFLNIGFFVPREWFYISDNDKFSGESWRKQVTISIFDYLPIYSEFPPITKAPDIPEILDGEAKILSYEKGSNFQKGIIDVRREATIRLPLYDFPGMKVKVDGNLISHYNNDCRNQEFCYGLISFKLSKGEHQIETKLTDTPIRKIGNLITFVSVLILIWLVIKNKRYEKDSK